MNTGIFWELFKGSWLIRLELGVIFVELLLIVLIWVPRFQIEQDLKQELLQPEEVPERVDEYRRTWAQIIGGIAILAGLYFTHRRLLATERNVEIARENQEATERQVEIAREGQITERFTRAIEQLGDEQLAMRLGGIYALERIARDSERDHWTVMEVLTAFVRESAPPVEEEEQEGGAEGRAEKVAPDVQAALVVIGRRNTVYDPEDYLLYLERVRIPNALLRAANFSKASLRGADFSGTDSYLLGVNFSGAYLGEADFSGAHLPEAVFNEVYSLEADFSGTDLRQTDFSESRLLIADFTGANLTGANLNGADLRGADLTGARYELEQLAEAASVEGIKGLSDEELAELERLRQEADEDDQQSREEGDSQ